MYDYKYVIEFPILMSTLPPTAQLNIELEGYKFNMKTYFNIFEEQAKLFVFKNGQHIVNIDDVQLYLELRPN